MREAGIVRGQRNVTYHFHFHALAQRHSYSVERLHKAAVINCLYQPGRVEGGRGVAYPYVNQLYRTRLDVVLAVAGHVTSVARIGRHYEFCLTFTLHSMLLDGIVPVHCHVVSGEVSDGMVSDDTDSARYY